MNGFGAFQIQYDSTSNAVIRIVTPATRSPPPIVHVLHCRLLPERHPGGCEPLYTVRYGSKWWDRRPQHIMVCYCGGDDGSEHELVELRAEVVEMLRCSFDELPFRVIQREHCVALRSRAALRDILMQSYGVTAAELNEPNALTVLGYVAAGQPDPEEEEEGDRPVHTC